MENPDFIRDVAATGKTVLLSTGGCQRTDVEKALDVAEKEGNRHVILLHGVQNFPTRVEDSHLRFIRTLKSDFGVPVGFLDHVDGGSPMARVLPTLARAFGADLIEKHITLDRSARGFDYESSLDPEPFAEMVSLIREAERASGDDRPPRQESAESYHRMMRRSVLSSEILAQGRPVKAEQLLFVRNEKGLSPKDAGRLVGRRPRRDIPAFEPLTEELFE
jgi:sialic acid synthase SpsE